MLSESSALFYRPKDKKLHADKARANFVRQGGDHFTLLNVWEQWADSNYSQTYAIFKSYVFLLKIVAKIRDWRRFCYEQFLQFKVLSRVRE